MPSRSVVLSIACLPLLLGALTTPSSADDRGAARSSSATSEVSPATDGPATLLIRFAAFQGGTQAGASLLDDLMPLQTAIEGTLADWDLRQDLAELQNLFGLAELNELARWSSTVPTPEGHVTTSVSARTRVELTSRLIDAKTVEVRVKLFDENELVAAPRMINEFGERMVMSTSNAKLGTFFLLFLEATPGLESTHDGAGD